MSDELKNIYKGAGALDRYFDGKTPVDLFRGKKVGNHGDLMQPTLVGWYTKKGRRDPDVLVRNKKSITPQYIGEGFGKLATEGDLFELTAEILRNADQYVVKGCRTMDGMHRGISIFDKRNPRLKAFDWYIISANSTLPDALAVTRDPLYLSHTEPNHYTIAPKDDMPLSLFLQYLKSMANQASLSNI